MYQFSKLTKSPAGLYAAFGLSLIGVFLASDKLAQDLLYAFVNGSAAVAVFVGAFRQPRGARVAWFVLALGLVATVSGDVIWTVYEHVLLAEAPYPSLADALYLGGYPLVALAVLIYCLARKPSRTDLIDVAILGIGYAVVTWAFFLHPYLEDGTIPWLERLVSAGYPAMDIPLVAVVALIWLTPGLRTSTGLLFTAAIIAGVSADIAYARAVLDDSYVGGGLMDIGWMAASILWGSAALHFDHKFSSSQDPTLRFMVTKRRLAFLATAALAGPAVWLVAPIHDGSLDLPIIAGATTLLVILVFMRLWETIKIVDRNERHFRALVEHSSDIITIYDPDGTLRYASPALLQMLGEEPLAWVNRSAMTLVHPEDSRMLRIEFVRLAKTPNSSRTVNVRLRHRDGSWRLFEVTATNRLSDPAVLGIVANARDVTDRTDAENGLRRTQAFSTAVIDSGYDGIFAFDRECSFTVWNPAMERTTGLSKDQVLGKNAFDLFPFLRETGEDALYPASLRGEHRVARVQPNRMPDTGLVRYFESHYSPLREATGEIVGGLCLVRDVTERTMAEHALSGRNRVLALMAEGGTLEKALAEICYLLEESLAGGHCYVMLIDRGTGNLVSFTGPTMPPGFLLTIAEQRGVAPGLKTGSCGAAAFSREPVVSADIATDPLWANCVDLALAYDLRSSWSVPILDGVDGAVLGTFAVFHKSVRAPKPEEMAQVVEAGHLAGITIRADRAQEAVRFQADLLDQVAAAVIATDDLGRVTHWNRHATTLYGWQKDEAVGRNIGELVAGSEGTGIGLETVEQLRSGQNWEGEILVRRKDESLLSVQLSVAPLTDNRGESIGRVGVSVDLSERKEFEARLAHQAFHDALTGLPNRTLFSDRLEHAFSVAGRRGESIAVLMLDLDRFKVINDGLGHAFGDRILVAVGHRIGHCLRDADTLARLGGDEFAILLEGITPAMAREVAARIISAFRDPLVVDSREIYTATSVGIAISAPNHSGGEEILRAADIALYRAKRVGRGTIVVFDPRDADPEIDWIALEADLRHALNRGELSIHYQPVVDLDSGAVVAVEALARWQHPTRGMVPPSRFIHLAEETGYITTITDWVTRKACRQLSAWRKELGRWAPASVNVNLTARDLRVPGLVARIDSALAEFGLPAECLRLEITEEVLVEELLAASDVLRAIRSRGIGLAIDDFGAGASSLASLRTVDAEVLKLDRSFIRDLGTSDDRRVVIGAITAMAHALGLRVNAEGVETIEQLSLAIAAGCDRGQGYLFAPPAPPDDVASWLIDNEGRSDVCNAIHLSQPELVQRIR